MACGIFIRQHRCHNTAPSPVNRIARFDIAGDASPATIASGDYFDYVPLVGGSIGIAIGDVSGHGLGAAFVMVQVTMMAVTLYLHRDQAHRSLALHGALRHFFRFWVWSTSGMLTREWVAVHRKHHAYCETADDPHSPQVYGLKKVLTEGAELYQAEKSNPETLEKFGRGTPDDWVERNVYVRFPHLGITLTVLADLLLFGVPGIIIIAVQMLAMPVFAAGIINGLGHHSGYRNFECDDAATNLVPWALLIGGEELHNNHHAFPSSAKLSARSAASISAKEA